MALSDAPALGERLEHDIVVQLTELRPLGAQHDNRGRPGLRFAIPWHTLDQRVEQVGRRSPAIANSRPMPASAGRALRVVGDDRWADRRR